jgi:hypothetical protein
MLGRKKEAELRERLPYGVYVGADGRETLYNRKYQPMMTRASVNDLPTPCKPDEWIQHVGQAWFFHDGNSPFHAGKKHRDSQRRCENVLISFDNQESINQYFQNMRGEV